MDTKYFVAFDLGATSGRTILGSLSDNKLILEEVTRFPNQMLQFNGHFYWNIFSLYENLKKGLAEVTKKKIQITSIGIDTWGVDVACIAPDKSIIGLPFAYRDPQTIGKKEEYFNKVMPAGELYKRTGIQHLDLNTLFQLYAMKQQHNFALEHAAHLLFMPDALSYMLTGNMVTEYTIASTSQLLNPVTRDFDTDLLHTLGLDRSLFSRMVEPGETIGMLSNDICEELQTATVPVIAVAGHDTASAVAAIPANNNNFAYLSSGTWSLMGIETDGPVINEKTASFNITNEGGVDGTIRLLKNITGMWLVEQCLKKWHKEGTDYTYPQMVELANKAKPFVCFIDPDDPTFTNPHSMPQAICKYCERTGQSCPQTHGEFIRSIFESLALKYREVLDEFRGLSKKPIEKLYIIGGGSRNKLLNQFTSNAIGLPVSAGPSEASSIGNIMLQAKAAGMVSTLQDMRNVISANVQPESFMPADQDIWNKAYKSYLSILKHSTNQ